MKPLLLILALATFSAQPFQEAPLVNSDVLQMAQAGLSTETIIAKIKASRTAFDTSPSALTDLKSKGVAEAVLQAMIGAPTFAEKAAEHPAEIKAAYESAVKALRRLANGVEVGVSFVEYAPLVADAKTEIDTALPRLPSGPFKDAALRALQEYQFAADVWRIYWKDEFISGNYKDIATKQYGVKKRGLLKVVWRDDFLHAIWREARRYYDSAVDPKEISDSNTTPTERLVGSWRLRLTSPSGSPDAWILTVHDRAQTLGELRIGSSSYSLHRISFEAGRFTIATKKRGANEIVIEAIIEGGTMRGTVVGISNREKINADFVGDRDP